MDEKFNSIPVSVIHFDKDGTVTDVEDYNLDKVEPASWALKGLAAALLPVIREFYTHEDTPESLPPWNLQSLLPLLFLQVCLNSPERTFSPYSPYLFLAFQRFSIQTVQVHKYIGDQLLDFWEEPALDNLSQLLHLESDLTDLLMKRVHPQGF